MDADVFDIDHWIHQFPLEGVPREYRSGCNITGPADIARVEQLRAAALVNGSDLAAVPCDVFIFAHGEPTRRDVTKINGLPFRPAGRAWPVNADGDPMTFLAQYRFTESRDIVGAVPGDILLVFATDRDLFPYDQPQETLAFEWYSLELHNLVSVEECPPPRWAFARCFGLRHRTVDYPSSEAAAFFMRAIPREARTSVPDDLLARPLCRLDGMKIGGAPLWFESGSTASGPDLDGVRGDFLCSLSSVEPSTDKPYPWVNRPEPITFHKYRQESLLFCNNGFLLNFFIDDSGRVTWGMQIFT